MVEYGVGPYLRYALRRHNRSIVRRRLKATSPNVLYAIMHMQDGEVRTMQIRFGGSLTLRQINSISGMSGSRGMFSVISRTDHHTAVRSRVGDLPTVSVIWHGHPTCAIIAFQIGPERWFNLQSMWLQHKSQ